MAKNGTSVAQEITPKKKELFIEALAELCNVTQASNYAEVSRRSMYRIRAEDPEFAAAWDKALQVGAEALEDELMRRAKDGVLKPVFYKGEICGEVKEYSDTLGIFLLKGAKPDKYKDRVEQEQKGAVEIVIRDLRGEKENPGSSSI